MIGIKFYSLFFFFLTEYHILNNEFAQTFHLQLTNRHYCGLFVLLIQLLVLFPVPAAAVNPPKNSKDEEHFESVP